MGAAENMRDTFWASPPALPPGLVLSRTEQLVVPRTGPGGLAVLDLATLATPAATVALLLAYRAPLLPRDVPKLKRRLDELLDDRKRRLSAIGQAVPLTQPCIVTDAATPAILAVCEKEGVGLLDQRGTVVVAAGALYVRVVGQGKAVRQDRLRVFAGKSARVVRHLLIEVAADAERRPRSVQAISDACELSYGHAYGVLTSLERAGIIERSSPRSGFRLRDPVGLLRAWMESNEKTSATVEGWYVPSTTADALSKAAAKLKEANGTQPVLTLASALDSEEIHVAGLPHGAYFPGEARPFIEALGGRRITPHNLLVLRADPVAETEHGGIRLGARPSAVPGLARVALPQLVVDFLAVPARGREQAQHLLERYAASLPWSVEPP